MSAKEIKELSKEINEEHKKEVEKEHGPEYRYTHKTNPKLIKLPDVEKTALPFAMAEGGYFQFLEEKVNVTFAADIIGLKLQKEEQKKKDEGKKTTYEHVKENLTFVLDTNKPSEELKATNKKKYDKKLEKTRLLEMGYKVLNEIDIQMHEKFITAPIPKKTKFTVPADRKSLAFRGILFEKRNTDKVLIPGEYVGHVPLNYFPLEKSHDDFVQELEKKKKTDPNEKLKVLEVPEKPITLCTTVIVSDALKKKLKRKSNIVGYDELHSFVRAGAYARITLEIQGFSNGALAYKTKSAIKRIEIISLSESLGRKYEADDLDAVADSDDEEEEGEEGEKGEEKENEKEKEKKESEGEVEKKPENDPTAKVPDSNISSVDQVGGFVIKKRKTELKTK